MRAMLLIEQRRPLELAEVPVPLPGKGQVMVKVHTCGVCRTDLHVLDGDLTEPKLPLILGHQIVGTIVGLGEGVDRFSLGQRIGVPWLGYTDGTCRYCQRGQENLCDHPQFTGYNLDGGYAEYAVADERYCFPLSEKYNDVEAAPLLCAGLIGYRTYRLAGEHVERLGIYGFGAAGHIIAQVAAYQGKRVYAFTRPGDTTTQQFARRLGAYWVGGSDEMPPDELDAALVLAPVGALMVTALKAVAKGGVVVSGGIHMTDIPSFPYHLLWEERMIRSVANLTRQDGEEFLALAPKVPVKTTVTPYRLEDANQALDDLRSGKLDGAAVLII
ncbi:MAG: alcohol dehydrogenase [Anaerolineales bacterium]|nr:zinc-dependent alcohol dehydrogenase family protein [Anaerolineae bacterium]PWB56438.1 MAG: alcohol dehydrogenase [Anaerolineales bacterium]